MAHCILQQTYRLYRAHVCVRVCVCVCVLVQGMVALTRSFARPEVLTDAFASTSLLARSPAADPAPAPAPPDAATLASCETNLLGRFRKLLQAKDLAIHSRVAVLQVLLVPMS